MLDERQIEASFASNGWRVIAERIHQGLGVSVSVLDESMSRTLATGPRGISCDSAATAGGLSSGDCVDLDAAPPVEAGVALAECRDGLPCVMAPVVVDGTVRAHVMLSEFVASSAERKVLRERLVASGLDERDARAVVRGIPILSSRRATAAAQMIASQAEEFLGRLLREAHHEEVVREMAALSSASRDFDSTLLDPSDLRAAIVEHAGSVSSAVSSALLVSTDAGVLEVAAAQGSLAESIGRRVFVAGGPLAPHLAQERASRITREEWGLGGSDQGHALLIAPARWEERIEGAIVLDFVDVDDLPSQSETKLLEALATRAAVALYNSARQRLASHRSREIAYVEEKARALHGSEDVEDLVAEAGRIASDAFHFDVGGVLVDAFGHELGSVVVRSEVSRDALMHVLAEAAGYQQSPDIAGVGLVLDGGEVVDSEGATGDWTVLARSLEVKGKTLGQLFAASRTQGRFTAGDARVMEALARHVSIALEKAAGHEAIRADLTRTITALSAMADAREQGAKGHSKRVMDYALAIGAEMSLGTRDLEVLRFAGLLHDVGKVGISEEILLKPAPLTEVEMDAVRRHAQVGASIVEQIGFLEVVSPAIMHHHERWDGNGYPAGLMRDEIPLLARILAVADSFEAMTSDRPYRSALTHPQARTEIETGSGTQFDPAVVEAFLEVLDRMQASGATGLWAEGLWDTEDVLPV
jgi:putative nucleotidyltransferase with HDIG domain